MSGYDNSVSLITTHYAKISELEKMKESLKIIKYQLKEMKITRLFTNINWRKEYQINLLL